MTATRPEPGTHRLADERFLNSDSLFQRINSSTGFDHRLATHDLVGSIAHARMLARTGIVDPDTAERIVAGLQVIQAEVGSGALTLNPALEDVHMNVEARLRELIGPVAGALHTGRSRNDQVALDLRLWVRDAIDRLDVLLKNVLLTLASRAETHAADVMPGFTHLQCAQPITIGHYLLAYAEMFLRDRSRFRAARDRLDECPLGAAALAGTTFPIDPTQTAAQLGFSRVFQNSLDAVSDRDFVLDYLAAGANLAIHLSRLGEEIVLWATPQFGFVAVPEQLSAGSSIMPQKRNPDSAELLRAKSGRVIGALTSQLMMLKGLPLGYNRDLQEDKEAVFDAADTLELCLEIAAALLAGLRFDVEKTRQDAELANAVATDLADWLVAGRGLTFRESHTVVSDVVDRLVRERRELRHLDARELVGLDSRFEGMPPELLGVSASVSRRRSPGGTAPELVRQAADRLGDRIW